MRHKWLASFSTNVDSLLACVPREILYTQSFTNSVFLNSVIGHSFACVCEVQLRLCIYFSLYALTLFQLSIGYVLFHFSYILVLLFFGSFM